MADKYAIVNTDLMSATDDRSRMRSFRYGTWDATKNKLTGKEIQNGSVVALNKELIDRDLWVAVDPAATNKLEDLVLVTSPEIMYDERKKNLNEFINEADVNATGMLMKLGDIFSVTEEGFNAKPKVGDTVTVSAGSPLLQVGATGGTGGAGGSGGTSSTGIKIGEVIDEWVRNRDTYWAVLVTG